MTFLRWLGLMAVSLIFVVLAPACMALWALLDWIASWFGGSCSIPAWLNTPDDPGPNQGMYEPQIADLYKTFGQRFKTWYWLGIRNQVNGLTYMIAPVTEKGALYSQDGPYPKTKGPFTAGSCLCTIYSSGATYREWAKVGSWSATKCWEVRIGWKVNAIANDSPGAPILPLLQIKPYLTINSTT
jgi:hypothetical protein